MAANAVNEFAQEVLSEWRPGHLEDNLIFSPLSIAVCFLLVYHGAVGKTREEFEGLFGFGNDSVESDLMSKLTKYSGDSVAKMANRVYVEKTVTLKESYVTRVGSANVELSDFVNAFEAARDEINAWVSERTARLLPDVIPPGVLSPDTVLVAVNALYFKGKWEIPFPAEDTKDDTFHAVGGDQTVPFMTLSGERFRVKEIDSLDSILFQMPYEGDEFAMYVLLPNKEDGWKTAEDNLSAEIGSLFSGGFRSRMVDNLKVPKWEMELSLNTLKEILSNLGIPTAFTRQADFSGITEDQPLMVSDVIHKAKIIVDEEGTEAAAATVAVVATSAVLVPPPPFDIIVDRPFLYFIVDEADGTVLFQGTQTKI